MFVFLLKALSLSCLSTFRPFFTAWKPAVTRLASCLEASDGAGAAAWPGHQVVGVPSHSSHHIPGGDRSPLRQCSPLQSKEGRPVSSQGFTNIAQSQKLEGKRSLHTPPGMYYIISVYFLHTLLIKEYLRTVVISQTISGQKSTWIYRYCPLEMSTHNAIMIRLRSIYII